MKKVFITREVGVASPLHSPAYALEGASLIAFEAIPYTDIPLADWLFFYSPNGVKFFFEPFINKHYNRSALPNKIAAIGEGTAAAILNYGFIADFVGDGSPKTTAEQFHTIATGQAVLFVQAQQSRNSIASMLGNTIKAIPFVVYKNTPISSLEKPLKLSEMDILVFTSPLNVLAFLQLQPILAHQQVIAIGETTADCLRQNGVKKIHLPAAPTEKQLADTIHKLLSHS